MDRNQDKMMPSEPELNGVQPSQDVQLPGNQLPAELRPEVVGLHEGDEDRAGVVCTCGQVVIPRGKTELGMVPSIFGEPGYVHRIPEEVTGEIRLEDGTKVKDVTNGGGLCHELT